MTEAHRRLLSELAGIAIVSALWGAPTMAAETVGDVVAAKGETALEREAGRQPANPGVAVLLDDRAMTGAESRLDMRLGQSTRIRLGANTVFKVDRFVAKASAATSLEEGRVLIERNKNAEKKFEVKTPYGLLAARGTTFWAGPSKGAFGVFVKEGELDVITPLGTATLHAGEGTDIAEPGDRPSPVKKWGAPRIQEALDSVR